MSDAKPVTIPFVHLAFSWDSQNPCGNFKVFKQRVDITFKGQFKDSNTASKVGAILN